MKSNKVIHIVFHMLLISYPQSLINLISKWIIIAVDKSLKCSYFPHFKAQVKRNIPYKSTLKTPQNALKIARNPTKTTLFTSILY